MNTKSDTPDYKVSVVVPHLPHTREMELDRLELALEKQTEQCDELIVISKNQSAAKNNNTGWKRAQGDIIWFLADDVVPEPKALENALKVFEAKHPDGVDGYMYGKVTRIFDWGFMTGHIFYTKAILETHNGFDENFEAWRYDTDFAWTVLDNGGTILYCPKSQVKHPARQGTRPDLEAEKLLKEKHPKRYAEAKERGYLGCLL